MNKLKNITFFFLSITLLFTSCRKDEEVFGSFSPNTPVPEVIVNGSFSGVVTDEDNKAIENTRISLGTNSVMTDRNGYFTFENVEINTKGSLIIAQKEGYFYNAKFVNSKLNKKNFVKIKMLEKMLTGSFQANEGGIISTDDGAAIQFAANAIKEETGGAYTGNVKVYTTWLDPTAPDLMQRTPGDLRGINVAGDQQQLTTFGMIGVELEGDAGQALNIAEGQSATIELPVPAELLANAPTTIPLWHFDEFTGYWIEEGEATLQGNKYVGTVSHFSFWNCDVGNDFIFIEGTVFGFTELPLNDVLVVIKDNTSGMSGGGRTNEDGVYSGAVPSNQELTICILNSCGEVVYTAPIGPFAADATIPPITVGVKEDFLPLSGRLVDCNNEPVTNGYLKIDFGNGPIILRADANGVFDELITVCDATAFEFTGFDIDNLKASMTITQETEDSTSINLASIFVCEDLTEFMTYNIGSTQFTDPDPKASMGILYGEPGFLFIRAFDPVVTGSYFILITSATTPGTYVPDNTSATYFDSTSILRSLECDSTMCNINLEITTYEPVGGFVIGSFSGTLDPFLSGGATQPVDGTFKVLLE